MIASDCNPPHFYDVYVQQDAKQNFCAPVRDGVYGHQSTCLEYLPQQDPRSMVLRRLQSREASRCVVARLIYAKAYDFLFWLCASESPAHQKGFMTRFCMSLLSALCKVRARFNVYLPRGKSRFALEGSSVT